ncbi:hypothetical protein WJ968_18835 [Achromobacter xylosoxidans]
MPISCQPTEAHSRSDEPVRQQRQRQQHRAPAAKARLHGRPREGHQPHQQHGHQRQQRHALEIQAGVRANIGGQRADAGDEGPQVQRHQGDGGQQ